MITHSQHHSLRRNRKGYSGIIAAIFLVLILLFLYFNVYTFMLDRNTAFQDTVGETQQMNLERNTEQVTLSDITFTVLGNNRIDVSCTINNKGSIPSQLVRLWVEDTTINKYVNLDIRDPNLHYDYVLPAGSRQGFTTTIDMLGVSQTDEITMWFVTGRGNKAAFFPYTPTEHITAREIGSILMNWMEFRYYDFGENPPQPNQMLPEPHYSCDVARDHYLIIGALFKNEDPAGRTLILTSDTYVWAVNPRGGESEPSLKTEFAWPICKVDAQGRYIQPFQPFDSQVFLPTPENSKGDMIYFVCSPSPPTFTGPYQRSPRVLNIIFYANTTTGAYGQNIPFVALKFLPTVTITVTSMPSGRGYVNVDGTEITTPHTFYWFPGGIHTLEANPIVPGVAAGVRYVWTNWSWTAPPSGSSTSQTYTYTVPSSDDIVTANYQTQYSVTFDYQISGGGSPTAPSVSYMSLGLPYSVTAGPSATVWADSGSTYTYTPNPLSGSSESQRWWTNQKSGTVSLSTTISPTYYHQYQVIFEVSPSGAGATDPAGTTWQNAGSTITITATKRGGFKFDHWSTNTGLITIADPTNGQGSGSSTTTATINGSGTITAYFT